VETKKESKGLEKLEFDGKVVKVDTIVDMIPQPVVALHIYTGGALAPQGSPSTIPNMQKSLILLTRGQAVRPSGVL
jgi:hypothetical protein